jgi:signal transduction histidine kinase
VRLRLSNWKISRTGLTLALIPLVLSSVFLVTLSYLLYQSKVQTRRAEQAREIQSTANSLGRCYFQAVSTVSSYLLLSHGDLHTDRFKALLAENEKLSTRLQVLVEGDKELSSSADNLRAAEAKAFRMLSTLKVARDGESADFLRIEGVKNEASSISTEVVDRLSQITTTLKRRQERDLGQRGVWDWRLAMEYFVYSGFFVSLAGTFFMQRLFGNEITKRLEVVVQNTQRLANDQPMLEPLSGGDEIAELDQTFHQMVDVLTEAEEMKREFIAMLTHDLRNPLTAIRLALEALSESESTGQWEQSVLFSAKKSINRLLGLINDLLDLDRLAEGKMPLKKEIVFIEEILKESIETLGGMAQEKEVALLQSCPEDAETFADKDRLQRVVINLLANAIRYSPKRDSIVVSCEEEDEFFRIAVTDHGEGIATEKQPLLFEKYRQLDRSLIRQGSGLGLAICKAIVESHGGNIGVVSEAGKGSTFWFTLPKPVE